VANLAALKQFILNISGDRLFNTGVVGSTSQLQQQMLELRKAFAELQSDPGSTQAQSNFRKNLLSAHAFSVITDDELHQCEQWIEEK